jgi:hypothetical protein
MTSIDKPPSSETPQELTVIGAGNEFGGVIRGFNILQSEASDVIVRGVHDWELDVLTEGSQSDAKNLAFACLGLAGGCLQNIWSLIDDVRAGKMPTSGELFFSAIFIACIAIGVTTWCLSSKKQSTASIKKTEIRERPLIPK